MRPFTLTTGVLLLVASSLAAPLLPRASNPQGGPGTSTLSEPYTDENTVDPAYDGLAKSYAATAHSWISWPFKRSLKARQEPYTDENTVDPAYDGLAKSYAATAHSWISWPGKRSLKARQSLTGDPIAGTLVATSATPVTGSPKLVMRPDPKNPAFASRWGWVKYGGRTRR